MTLPVDAKRRKDYPLFRGLLKYFPNALAAVADLSRVGNEQHNPGQPLHWAKEKSTDEQDALMRHLLDTGKRDTDGVRHSTKVAWRALAALEREIEADGEEPGQVIGDSGQRDETRSSAKVTAGCLNPPCREQCDPVPLHPIQATSAYDQGYEQEWLNSITPWRRGKQEDAGLGPDPTP
jgi:hypothetical protein